MSYQTQDRFNYQSIGNRSNEELPVRRERKTRLVIDDSSIYEVDVECERIREGCKGRKD